VRGVCTRAHTQTLCVELIKGKGGTSARHNSAPAPAAVLLFKCNKACVQRLCCPAWQVVQRILVNCARALWLLGQLLKLGKAQEELLLRCICMNAASTAGSI
jgi:hypothetical protein